MRPCARRIVSAASVVKATSLDDGPIDHAPWRRAAPAALLIRIKPLAQPEQADRVLLQDQRPHLGPDLELVEVREPALRGDERDSRCRTAPGCAGACSRSGRAAAGSTSATSRRGRCRPAACACAIESASSCQGTTGGRGRSSASGKSTATSSTWIGFEYLSRIPPPPGRPEPTPEWPVWNSAGRPASSITS